MSAIQLNFTLRTSANCKTVHLIGSWDGYKGQFPLSKDTSKSGGWKGTFRFQGSTLKQGQRYWYYYIIDGYHVSHDPARESVTEPTTGRKLNVLDIPTGKSPDTSKDTSKDRSNRQSTSHSRRHSAQVPKGRSLSPSKIQSPVPTKPHATRHVVQENFSNATVEALSAKLSATSLSDSEDSDSDSDSDSGSESGSDVPSLTTSRSSNNSSPSSVSSASSCCTCERYGITRTGDRVKLDCGGSRCGYSDNSECSSDSEDEAYRVQATRRQGVHVRSK